MELVSLIPLAYSDHDFGKGNNDIDSFISQQLFSTFLFIENELTQPLGNQFGHSAERKLHGMSYNDI